MYDELGRQIQVIEGSGESVTPRPPEAIDRTENTYDDDGRLTRVASPEGTILPVGAVPTLCLRYKHFVACKPIAGTLRLRQHGRKRILTHTDGALQTSLESLNRVFSTKNDLQMRKTGLLRPYIVGVTSLLRERHLICFR